MKKSKVLKLKDISSNNVRANYHEPYNFPTWKIQLLDFNHQEWGWNRLSPKVIMDIFEKLKNYELMSWNEIKKNSKRDHSVLVADLNKEAQKRLKELKLDDIDELFRLRLNGRQRIWGISDRHILKILWWDPNHTVCPSKLRNT